MVSTEQVALDDGRWPMAWLLIHQPEPPLSLMGRKPGNTELARPFARIADPWWIAAAIAYVKDVDPEEDKPDKRKNPKGKGKGKEAPKKE